MQDEDEYISIEEIQDKHENLRCVYQLQPASNLCNIKLVGQVSGELTNRVISSFVFGPDNQDQEQEIYHESNQNNINIVLTEVLHDDATLTSYHDKLEFFELFAGYDDPFVKITAYFHPITKISKHQDNIQGHYSIIAWTEDGSYKTLEEFAICPLPESLIETMMTYLTKILSDC